MSTPGNPDTVIKPEPKKKCEDSAFLSPKNKNKEIDLRGIIGKKKKVDDKRVYDLVDDEIKKITLDGDIVVKLISNNKGVFVDFRKHFKGYPTKKGIRVAAIKFREVSHILDKDISKLVPDQDLDIEDLLK